MVEVRSEPRFGRADGPILRAVAKYPLPCRSFRRSLVKATGFTVRENVHAFLVAKDLELTSAGVNHTGMPEKIPTRASCASS